MFSDLVDTDAAVIEHTEDPEYPEDPKDTDIAVLEYPESPDDLDGKNTTSYEPDSGKGRIGGVNFDLGAVIKGTADAVTKTATTVADIVKTAKTEEKKAEPPPEAKNPAQPQPIPSENKPVTRTPSTGSSAGFAVVFGVLGVSVLGAALALRAGAKRRRAL